MLRSISGWSGRCLFSAFLAGLIFSLNGCKREDVILPEERHPTAAEIEKLKKYIPRGKDVITFEGIVEKGQLGPNVQSGIAAFHSVVSYQVTRVFQGQYDASHIVVDHLSLCGSEVEWIKIGDHVCVSVSPLTVTKVRQPDGKTYAVPLIPDLKGKLRLSGEALSASLGVRSEEEALNTKIMYLGGAVLPPPNACPFQ